MQDVEFMYPEIVRCTITIEFQKDRYGVLFVNNLQLYICIHTRRSYGEDSRLFNWESSPSTCVFVLMML